MAFRRRRSFRRFRRRGRFGRRRSRFGGVARGYRTRTRFELKLCDKIQQLTVSNMTLTGASFTLLNGLKQGSNYWEHSGSTISMKSLMMRLVWQRNPNWTGAACTTRILIVYDKFGTGTTPTLGEVMSSVNNAGTIAPTPLAGVNPNTKAQYVIVYDRFLSELGMEAAAPLNPTQFYGRTALTKIYIRLRGLKTIYNNGNTGGIGDIMTGPLYLVVWTNCANIDDIPYQVYSYTRLRWTD